MRSFLPLLLVVALFFGATTPAHAASNNWWEGRITYHINKVKDNHDLPNVTRGRCVDRRAERFKNHLRVGHFHHHSLKPLLRRCNGRYAGEVLARGYDTPYKTVRAWMNSPGHRAIILSGKYRKIGVGVRGTHSGKLVVANFLRH